MTSNMIIGSALLLVASCILWGAWQNPFPDWLHSPLNTAEEPQRSRIDQFMAMVVGVGFLVVGTGICLSPP